MRAKRLILFISVLLVLGFAYGGTWLLWLNYLSAAKASLDSQQFAKAEDQLSSAIKIAQPFSLVDFRYLYSQYLLGTAYGLDNKQSLAEPIFNKLEALYRNGSKPFAPTEFDVLFAYGSIYVSSYQPAKAVPFFHRALALLEKEGNVNSEFGANLLNILGKIHRDQGLTEKAIPFFQRSLQVRRTVYGTNSEEALIATFDAGFNDYVAGNYEAAADKFQQALALSEHLSGDKKRRLGSSARNGLAAAYIELGKQIEAQELLNTSMKESRPGDHSITYTLGRLGQIFDHQDRPQEATRFYKKALSISETMNQLHHPDFVEAMTLYYKMLARNGQTKESERIAKLIESDNHPERTAAAKIVPSTGIKQ